MLRAHLDLAKILNLADKTYRTNGTALLSDAKGTLSDKTILSRGADKSGHLFARLIVILITLIC